jgi:dihydroxyacetone kinase-like predicted kinase
VNDVLVTSGTDPLTVLRQTLEQMGVAEREVITLYFGEGVTTDVAQGTAQEITAWYPEQQIEVVDGGQPHYTYIISVE